MKLASAGALALACLSLAGCNSPYAQLALGVGQQLSAPLCDDLFAKKPAEDMLCKDASGALITFAEAKAAAQAKPLPTKKP